MESKRRTSIRTIAMLLVLSLAVAGFVLSLDSDVEVVEQTTEVKPVARHAYGFSLDSFDLDYFEMKPNEFLGDILSAQGIEYKTIDALAKSADSVFSVRRLRPGKRCAFVKRKGTGYLDCFVYQPNDYQYVRFFTDGSSKVEIQRHEIEKCVESSGGVLHSSLWQTMYDLGHPLDLISKMEDALAWSVSFHHVKKGDEYKLIYERDYIGGVPVGVGKLIGASFENGGKTNYAIYFESDGYRGYYDPEGRPMKRAFLKAPVQYSRISSRYNPRRFHPVLKRFKGHYGTDYAADPGTPIRAVADGVITKASYTKNNGNYVKMRHDQTYETQYLHMQGFARGIKPGVRVSQGDVIGYVGSTGLATGPHVCFRFWKNGKQVDHLRENLPPPDPMPEEELPSFYNIRDIVMPRLESIPIGEAVPAS